MKYQFPENFYWGAACSSHQWEGGLTNDWTEWETANAAKLAQRARLKLADWQLKKFPQATDPQNYVSGQACDHYHRYEEDYRLAGELKMNAFRTSVAWERIEPREGEFDQKELEHYAREVESMRANGLEPFVTLWHWPVPLWLRDQGGWESKNIIQYFTRYTEKVVEKLDENVSFWLTINEPWVYCALHYQLGTRPPAVKSLSRAWGVYNRLMQGHIESYKIIKDINPRARVGAAVNLVDFDADPPHPVNNSIKAGADWLINYRYLEAIKKYQDFIGLNHYFHNRIDWGVDKNRNEKISDMGWELYPESMYRILMELKRYRKPIVIAENGLADAEDKQRQWFLRETLKNVYRAIIDGADVRGYLHWSFMDNFEWDHGFWPQFGLVRVNRQTLERQPRQSAYFYKGICENNGF